MNKYFKLGRQLLNCSRPLGQQPDYRRSLSAAAQMSESYIEQLRSCVSGDTNRLTSSSAVRDLFGKDESHFIHSPLPDLVAFPNSSQEVSDLLKFCHTNNINVVPFGTGTGLEGGVTCPEHQKRPYLSLSMTNMAEITALNVEDFDVTVQPGVSIIVSFNDDKLLPKLFLYIL